MKQRPRLVLATVLILGWLFDFLFWRQAPGINFALYAGLCLVGGFFLLGLDGKRIAPRSFWLLPLILFLAAASFIRAEPLTVFLAMAGCLFLLAVLAITALSGRWLEFRFGDYLLGLVLLLGGMLSLPLTFQSEISGLRQGNRSSAGSFWSIVRGLLILLPVLLIFGALLASADLVFNKELADLAALLRLENLPQYIFRLVYILVVAYLLAGVFLFAARDSLSGHLPREDRQANLRFLGFTESSIVLGGLLVLFAAFVIVQFRYFFGGQVNIGLQGFTYAEYARRGYGELMAVAFFSLLLILGLGAVTRRELPAQQRWFSSMSVGIVALVGVMLVSAFMRLSLYEAAYGFSRLRTYVHVSLVWLGLLLAAVVVLELLRRERNIVTAALAAGLGFAISLTVLNVDALIARQNIRGQQSHAQLDVAYLASLSTDAVPEMVSLFWDPTIPAARREATGAALACRLHRPADPQSEDWRSFTVSRSRAITALESVRGALTGYRWTESGYRSSVGTPSGVSYDCWISHD